MVTRPAAELAQIVMAEAKARGQSYSEFIATCLAEQLDRPDLAPPPPKVDHQEERPHTG